MSNDNNVAVFLGGWVIGILFCVPVSCVGTGMVTDAATKAGAGEWTIDPKTGVRAWKWTPAVKPVEK